MLLADALIIKQRRRPLEKNTALRLWSHEGKARLTHHLCPCSYPKVCVMHNKLEASLEVYSVIKDGGKIECKRGLIQDPKRLRTEQTH